MKKMFIAAVAAAGLFVGCGGATTVSVTETDSALTLSPNSAPAGDISVTDTNSGKNLHELVFFQTELAEDALPLDASGDVDESGPGITHIDPEVEDLASGDVKTATLHLAAGRYVAICNSPGHYKAGMHAVFTVK